MSMPAYTPGPWTVELSRGRGTLCVMAGSTWICGELQADNDTALPYDECEANARLIAAAPDMLAALRAIIFQACQGKILERDACITQARAAITKAEGATPNAKS